MGMGKKKKIVLSINELAGHIASGIIENAHKQDSEKIRVEDYFDLSKLSKEDVLGMATDLRVYLYGRGFDSSFTQDGNLVIKEGASNTTPIKQLRNELRKLGFKQWQIKSEIACNKVRVVILYADVVKNTDIIEKEMLSLGWTLAHTSDPTIVYGVPVRVMNFDPKEQRKLTKDARKYHYLYHWTPYKNLASVLRYGIEPRSENDFLSYPPRVHLIKGDTPKHEAAKLGWMLFNINKKEQTGAYALVRVNVKDVPENVDFFGDPRFSYGYFTTSLIPPEAIEFFGRIQYTDKYNYNNEDIVVVSQNDTMSL